MRHLRTATTATLLWLAVDSIAGAQATCNAGPLADPGKPASDLRWATSAAGLGSTTNHMGASSMLFNQGAGAITTALFLRTLWSFTTDVPGTYSLAIRFTFSAP